MNILRKKISFVNHGGHLNASYQYGIASIHQNGLRGSLKQTAILLPMIHGTGEKFDIFESVWRVLRDTGTVWHGHNR